MLGNRGFPEAWSRLCVCQASFLMTFAMGGVPHAGPRHSTTSISRTLPVCMLTKALQLQPTLRHYGLWPTRLPCPWDFPGKNTGKGFHFLFQGIFSTPGSNSYLCLLHCQEGSLPWVAPGKPIKNTTIWWKQINYCYTQQAVHHQRTMLNGKKKKKS